MTELIDVITEQITNTKTTLNKLQKQYINLIKTKHGDLINKYYLIVDSCVIKITNIQDFDPQLNVLYCSCIVINSGFYVNGNLTVNITDDYPLSLDWVNDPEEMIEITKEQFNQYFDSYIEFTKNVLNNI